MLIICIFTCNQVTALELVGFTHFKVFLSVICLCFDSPISIQKEIIYDCRELRSDDSVHNGWTNVDQ